MKIQVKDYTFNKTSKTVTFNDYTSIDLDGILLITNVTSNTIIYNFAATGQGGTVSGNVLTLDYDTSSMSDSDSLQIFYDDPDRNAVSEELITALKEMTGRLAVLASMSDGKHSLRVTQTTAALSSPVTLASTTLTAVTTFGGMSSNELQRTTSNPLAILSNINNIAITS